MKKENTLTILIIVLLVLGGIWYVNKKETITNNSFQPTDQEYSFNIDEVRVENPQEQKKELPTLISFPTTKNECQKFVNTYLCQEGDNLPLIEGRKDCNPTYSRTAIRCQAFINGKEDPYGDDFGNSKSQLNLSNDAYTNQ